MIRDWAVNTVKARETGLMWSLFPNHRSNTEAYHYHMEMTDQTHARVGLDVVAGENPVPCRKSNSVQPVTSQCSGWAVPGDQWRNKVIARAICVGTKVRIAFIVEIRYILGSIRAESSNAWGIDHNLERTGVTCVRPIRWETSTRDRFELPTETVPSCPQKAPPPPPTFFKIGHILS
jgi:hypothetical protein